MTRTTAFATTIALALLSAGPTRAPAMAAATETETNRQIVADAFQTWEQGTYVFGKLLSENVVWTIHGPGPAAGDYTDMGERLTAAYQHWQEPGGACRAKTGDSV